MASAEEQTAQILNIMSQMMSKIDNLSGQVTTVGHRMSTMEKDMKSLRGQMSDFPTYTTVEQARHGIASLVCFNHSHNITFFGLQPRPGMSVDEMLRNFMFESLHIDQELAMNMHIYVQETAKLSPQDMYPPVCVSFSSNKDFKLLTEKIERDGIALKEIGIWAKWVWLSGIRVKKSY